LLFLEKGENWAKYKVGGKPEATRQEKGETIRDFSKGITGKKWNAR